MIVIAGPCVIESREVLFKIADELEFLKSDESVDFYFKASFDKANRTSLKSFRGPGIDEGLRLLGEIKKEFGYKILTDIHESFHASMAAEIVDVLQIPAFLCRQTDLIVAAASTDAIVNIKKGQFMEPSSMRHSVLKALETRGVSAPTYETSSEKGIWLTERGSSFGYSNLVVDFRSLPIMREYAPVIFDATHSIQRPSALGESSGGDSQFAPALARAAAAVGVDGIFAETHIDPKSALSDSANMLKIDELKNTLSVVKKIMEATK
ncbi:MAG: 3-deoxy-8-phosphooctulonate synthase [Campylobacterales bacterium]